MITDIYLVIYTQSDTKKWNFGKTQQKLKKSKKKKCIDRN